MDVVVVIVVVFRGFATTGRWGSGTEFVVLAGVVGRMQMRRGIVVAICELNLFRVGQIVVVHIGGADQLVLVGSGVV